ncbi:MAG TPA: M20/M25/M40 family metallo-hydrolase [Bryobacteraceae bacterium]|nr:M20/M25/M40 family metallo-hydrolase [Bryobacteraceae bacterium]
MTSVLPQVNEYVRSRSGRLTALLQDLVARPSENRAPLGSERACQEYIAERLREAGWEPVLYTPAEVPGIEQHPLYWPGRDYTNRPNVGARRAGSGGGRSLVISGHVDTVPIGAEPWTRDPFGGQIEGSRLYGRGSNDMKCGIATNVFVVEALRDLDIRLAGDLVFESVVDEEFGGVNGTLAGRLMDFNADAAIISEPTSLRVCPAQRGGRTVHITFRSPNDGILCAAQASAIEQLRVFLNGVAEFQAQRLRSVSVPAVYDHLENPVPATVTRVHTAAWGTSEPTNVPSVCRVEFFWQAMPGESLDAVDREFHEWFDAILSAHRDVFVCAPQIEHPIRWLPGSALDDNHPLLAELSSAAADVRKHRPLVQGIEGPCDLYVFHRFGIPAALWGASGGNTHNPDEYVELDSLADAAAVLLTFICRWCGVASAS